MRHAYKHTCSTRSILSWAWSAPLKFQWSIAHERKVGLRTVKSLQSCLGNWNLFLRKKFWVGNKRRIAYYSGLIKNYFAIGLNGDDESGFVQVMAFLPALSSVCVDPFYAFSNCLKLQV